MRAGHHTTRAVAVFALSGMLAVGVLGFAGFQVLRDRTTQEAIENAKSVTSLAGDGIVAPTLTSGWVVRGSPAYARLDRLVRSRVLRGAVVRVKIWDTAGQILYSDEPRLVGDRFPLEEDERRALATGGTAAGVSDLSHPENRLEPRNRKLLEVYHGIRSPSGQRLLFEAYLRFSSIAASSQRLWRTFAPTLIGVLVLLELAQIPLALSLARRLRRGQEERERLLQRAIEASETERARIARDLHDGVVQNLAGVSYSLSAARGQLNGDPGHAEVDRALEEGARETRRSVRELRSLLVDLYPPDLHRSGLRAAIADLTAPAQERGMAVRLKVAPEVSPGMDTERLFFRVAQEALRNVVRHSEAATVDVEVRQDRGRASLTVTDDGRGFSTPAADTAHFGLRMLADLARAADAELEVRSTPGGGTTVHIEAAAR